MRLKEANASSNTYDSVHQTANEARKTYNAAKSAMNEYKKQYDTAMKYYNAGDSLSYQELSCGCTACKYQTAE